MTPVQVLILNKEKAFLLIAKNASSSLTELTINNQYQFINAEEKLPEYVKQAYIIIRNPVDRFMSFYQMQKQTIGFYDFNVGENLQQYLEIVKNELKSQYPDQHIKRQIDFVNKLNKFTKDKFKVIKIEDLKLQKKINTTTKIECPDWIKRQIQQLYFDDLILYLGGKI